MDFKNKIKNFIRKRVKTGGFLWHILVAPQRFRRHGLKIFTGYWKEIEIRKMIEPLRTRQFERSRVSIVMQSAGRKEYLQKTIESIQKYLQFDLGKVSWLIIDDYPQSRETRDYIKSLGIFDKVILNERNRGIGYSINRIFAEVQTEFVLYWQEDYELVRPVDVIKMIHILKSSPHLSQLMLLGNKEFIGAAQLSDEYFEYYKAFGFWPYLASMEFLCKVLPFPLYFTAPEFTFKIHKRGFRTAGIMGKITDSPMVKHIGEERKVLVLK